MCSHDAGARSVASCSLHGKWKCASIEPVPQLGHLHAVLNQLPLHPWRAVWCGWFRGIESMAECVLLQEKNLLFYWLMWWTAKF